MIGSMQWSLAADSIPIAIITAATPRVGNQIKILSPFDNTVIQRERLIDLFGFDYQIECYVPEAKRKFGYFCLPVLCGDRLIGRIDPKLYRDTGVLELKMLQLEETKVDLARLAEAIQEFASFQGADAIRISATRPSNLARPLTPFLTARV